MLSIHFYTHAPDRLQAAVAWVAGAYAEGRQVVAYVPQAAVAEQFERLLWTAKALSFLPHCRAESPLAADTPIWIATHLDNLPGGREERALVNLADEIPPGFESHPEVIEIISTEDVVRLPARERFKFYRERGYPLETHHAPDTLGGR